MPIHPLQTRWLALTSHFIPTDKAEALWQQLESHYTRPGRAYHNLQHISDCFAQFEMAKELAHQRLPLELAIFYHDVIYDPQEKVRFANEEKSATFAQNALQQAGIPASEIGRVVQLILDTRHDESPQTADGRLLVDIDLAILGADEARFWRYEEQIREEYSWVEETAYRTGRTTIMQGFLNRDQLYLTDFFKARLESQARKNLQSLIDKLATI